MQMNKTRHLFPFNRSWRFGRDVVNDAVDSLHFIDDAIRDDRHQVVGQTYPIGRHTVRAVDSANRERMFIRPDIAHDANALDWKKYSEGLPDLAVQPGLFDFGNQNVVSLLEHAHAFFCDLAHDSDREARPWQRLAP